MLNNKIKKIILMVTVSTLFGGMNGLDVSAKDLFEEFKEFEEKSKIDLDELKNQYEELVERLTKKASKNKKKFNELSDMVEKIKRNNSEKNVTIEKSNKINKLTNKNDVKNFDFNINEQEYKKIKSLEDIDEYLKSFNYDKSFDKANYMVEGYYLLPLKKDNVNILYYVHKETKAQFVFFLTKLGFTSLEFACSSFDDAGRFHVLEHLLSSIIIRKLAELYGFVDPKMFNAQTIEYGIYYLINNGILDDNILDLILEELDCATLLKKEGVKLFESEGHGEYKGNKTGRAYNEVMNNTVFKKYESNFFRNLNKYSNGGIPEQMLNITREEMIELYKKYIRPNNMLFIGTFGDDAEKIKRILNKFGESSWFKNSKNSFLKPVEKLKSSDIQFYQLSENSPILSRPSWDGKSKKYKYAGRVCFNVKNLSAAQKDALNLWASVLEYCSSLQNNLKKMGYEFSCYDGVDALKGEVSIVLYGDKKENFESSTLISNVKNILVETGEFFNSIKNEYGNIDKLMDLNPSISKKYVKVDNFSKPNKYRNESIFEILLYSFNKYKVPFSNRVFTINNKGEILDNEAIVEKNMRENVENIFMTLAKQPVKYVSTVEGNKNIEEQPKEDLLKQTSFSVKGCEENVNLYRFIEYIIKLKADDKIDSFGLSYKGLLKSPYPNGNFMCIANSVSKQNIEKFLNGEFKDIMKKYDLNKLEFISKLKSYGKNMSREIDMAKSLKKMLENCYKSVLNCVQNNYILSDKYSLFVKLKDNLQDLNVIFKTEEEFKEYRKKIKEFENSFDYYYSHQNNNTSGKEDEFLKFLINYIEFNMKMVVTVHNNLVELVNNINTFGYDEAKRAIEMNS